jgi:hypothetical protein
MRGKKNEKKKKEGNIRKKKKEMRTIEEYIFNK